MAGALKRLMRPLSREGAEIARSYRPRVLSEAEIEAMPRSDLDIQGLHRDLSGSLGQARGGLRRRGFARIGKGQWGETYRHGDEGLVAKSYRSLDAGYDNFLAAVPKSGSMHFPLMAEPIRGRWGSKAVLMERLLPLTEEDKPLYKALVNYAYSGKDPDGVLPQSLRGAIDHLRETKRRNRFLMWDFPDARVGMLNVMKRPDGTFVITDPFQHASIRIAAGFGLPIGLGAGVLGLNEGLKAVRDTMTEDE